MEIERLHQGEGLDVSYTGKHRARDSSETKHCAANTPMDISDIASLVAGSTLPLCVGIASLAVGCVLKYKEAPSKPPAVPSKIFEPRCNDDYVKLKEDLRAGTHSMPVLVQGEVTEAPNKGTFGGRFDSWVHNKETALMKDDGKSAAGKARRNGSKGYYAEVSETTFSIPFHLQNKDMESIDKDITVTIIIVTVMSLSMLSISLF